MENNANQQTLTILEKYFPKSWEDLILPDQILDLLREIKSQKGYRLLLHSSPGTGKTTTSRLIALGDDRLYLSGSNDFTIDVLRNRIMGFASGFSVDDKIKTIIIDEAENIRDNLQDAFKIILDTATSTNFIFITNEVEKINPALRSRCTSIDYDFSGPLLEEQQLKYIEFITKVCDNEKITWDKKGIKKLFILNYPDFRHLLVNMQELISKNLDITVENIKTLAISGKQNLELYKVIMDNSIQGKDFYQEASKYSGKEREIFLTLGEPFFEFLNSQNLHEKTLQSALIVSNYSAQYITSINKFVTLLSCIVELKSLFK
jgi:replication factor C subunit 3/5